MFSREQPLLGFLGPLAVADVANEAGKGGAFPASRLDDRELDWEPRAIRADPGEFDATIQNRRRGSSQDSAQSFAVAVTQLGRDDEAGELFADSLLAAVAERSLGRGVEVDDVSVRIHRDH